MSGCFSGSVEVEASTAGIQSPPVPRSEPRASSPKTCKHQQLEARAEEAHRTASVAAVGERSPPRIHGANSPQRIRVASPVRMRPTGAAPVACTPPVQLAPPVAPVRSPPQRTAFKDGQTATQAATFTPFNARGASPALGTKKLGGSISSHAMLHVRKASPDHVYPVREYSNKTSY